jgi:hypothetical protein
MLYIIPHILSPTHQATQVEQAIGLEKSPLSAKHCGRLDLLTGDELGFHFTTNHEHIWIPDGAQVPTRSRHSIRGPNRILTIFWSPSVFPSSEFSQRDLILMRVISAPRSFLREIEFVSQMPPKIRDKEWFCVSTMTVLTQQVQLFPICGPIR